MTEPEMEMPVEPEGLEDLDDAIRGHYGYIIDENSKMIQWSRTVVRDMQDMADRYRLLAEECDHISELHAIASRKLADLTGDILSVEFGITEVDNGTPKEDEEDYDDEEE